LSGIKKYKGIVIVLVLCILMAGSVFAFYQRYQYELSFQFKDTNGSDKSLCFITDEMISERAEECYIIRRKVTTKGESTSGVSGKYEEFDNDYAKTKTKMLSGIYISNVYLGDGKQVTYKFVATVHSGNFKIVITDHTRKILHVIPIDQESQTTFFAEKDTTYFVKFVGESAEIEVEMWRSEES